MKKKLLPVLTLLLVFVIVTVATAEDGDLFRRNVSKTPAAETLKAAIFMMDFYVPAQAADGTVGPVDNYVVDDGLPGFNAEGERLYDPRNYAKPLISVYVDAIDHEEEVTRSIMSAESIEATATGVVFGAFDAFVGYSLDDGTTWRTENLSRHADLSSFTLGTGQPFPGMAHSLVHQVAEDKILVAWASKFCKSGFPLYSLNPADPDTATYLASLEAGGYMADTGGGQPKNALYLYDFFGVSGNQGSVDYTLQGWPEVGEVPYSCVWSVRGKLIPGDDPKTEAIEASHVVWAAPERLTSGVRDANQLALDCAGGAGCVVTWQEDPEGLRPGKGLGPGEGWSGAIANAKTDIWYTYITLADFDYVKDAYGNAILIEEYEATLGAAMDRPKPYVPMAIPVRLTDNDMCRATAGLKQPEDPFCWMNFDNVDDLNVTSIVSYLDGLDAPETDANFCASTVQWTNPGGTTLDICVTRDGRWMIGRVGSTRVRMIIKPYLPAEAVDWDGDGVLDKSAWLSLGVEETKALGITVTDDATYDPIDIGKDMYYYSFDYAKPYNLHVNTALDVEGSSPYIVQQGGMINQPAKCSPWFIASDQTHPDIELACAAASSPDEAEFFAVQIDPLTGYEYYLTEISRRFALTLNNPANIYAIDAETGTVTPAANNASGLSGILIYKQGIIWQGGPADIMLRRTIIPDVFDPATDNPYAFDNMECVNEDGTSAWAYTDDTNGGVNPNYLEGLCLAPAINISGTTIVRCTTGEGNDVCAADFPVSDEGIIPDDLKDEQFPKVLEWRNCDGVSAVEGCEDDNDLDDQSWENPYDMAKGHRGFVYGDMVMMMYAWTPNWQSNAKGNDHYNLYMRRSFDGGDTWTTTPGDWCGPVDGLCGDGASALEYYYGASTDKIGDYLPYLWVYGAGEFEQARNLSLLRGNKVTVLDPRYSPGGGLKQYSTIRTDWLAAHADVLPSFEDELPYLDDEAIDPSKFILIYETGDNTVDYDTSAAIPLDLFYSRATVFGDVLEYYDYFNDEDDCNPVDGVVDWSTCIEPRFPWLENKQDDLSGEASVVLNPGGTFSYQVWNQWKQETMPDGHELIYDSDSIFRRLMYSPDSETATGTPSAIAPLAYISYVSHDKVIFGSGETLLFAGGARDYSGLGIVAYKWRIDGSGTLGSEQVFRVNANTLTMGPHTIYFSAQDGNGKWSREVRLPLVVWDGNYYLMMPIVNR